MVYVPLIAATDASVALGLHFGHEYRQLGYGERNALIVDLVHLAREEDLSFGDAAFELRARIAPASLESYVATLQARPLPE
jgi:hypothetical protein